MKRNIKWRVPEGLIANDFKVCDQRIDYLNHIKKFLPKNPVCIELGVHKGEFSRKVIDILKPKKLYLVDPWEIGSDKYAPTKNYTGKLKGYEKDKHPTAYSTNTDLSEVLAKMKSEIEEGIVEIKKGFSYDFPNDFSEHYFDLIYIDATHIYESAKNDLKIYLPKLKPGGLMAGHDYIVHRSFTVKKAVDEFTRNNKFKFIAQGKPFSKVIKGKYIGPCTDWAAIKSK